MTDVTIFYTVGNPGPQVELSHDSLDYLRVTVALYVRSLMP